MLAIALIDIRFWFRWAYLIYAGALLGLIAVEISGHTSMGAQRWINLGLFQLQPSEVMKIALVLALARYFHGAYLEDVARPARLLLPLAMILAPAALVLKQPDLGTAIMLLAGGATLLFLAGVRWWKFALVIGGVLAALPILWQQLHDYQKQRVMTFLNPERDPLGAGYHIIQSKIALGSGGIWGKGFLKGTQSQLNFLPEKQTDFVFTMLAEEAGLVGALGLLALFLMLVAYGFAFGAARAQPVRPPAGDGHHDDLLPLRRDQHRDGHRADPGGRRAAAADLLRRHGDADRADRLRPDAERRRPPRRQHPALPRRRPLSTPPARSAKRAGHVL